MNDGRTKEVTAPLPLTDPTMSAGRKLTDAEIDALMMRDTAFTRQLRNAQQRRASALLVDDGSGSTPSDPSTSTVSDPSSAVTASGGIVGGTTTEISLGSSIFDRALALWASETKVTSGYALRVFLQTQGDYTQVVAGSTVANLRRFSGVCGQGTWELFKQDCKLGDAYTDVSCYPSTTGHIFAQSQHSATFLTTTVTLQPSVKISRCSDVTVGGDDGAGGDDTCNDYQLVDDPSGLGSGTDCSSPSGTGDPSDPSSPPNTTSDWQKLCDELLLDPGCYDVYVDGSYDSTICC